MSSTSLDPGQGSGRPSPLLAVLDDGRLAFAALTALFLASAALQFALPANHDAAWELHAAKAFLEGGTLYDDIYFEMNLPLPMLLALPPVAVSELTGVFVVSAFRVYVFAWILLSCWLSWRLLEGLAGERQRRGLLFVFLGAMALLTADHFGQREHYLVIAMSPYLILAARRAEGLAFGPGGAAFVGFFAALGFALKPHFLLVLLAVEAYLLWRNRNLLKVFRPETLSLGITGLTYFLLVVLLTPAFFSFIVPMALDLYGAYDKPLLEVVVVEALPILGLALFLQFYRRGTLDKAALTDILCLSALCFFAIYLVQRKGWAYHLYPTAACLVMFLGTIILAERRSNAAPGESGQAASRSLRSTRLAATLGILALVGSGANQAYASTGDLRLYLTHLLPVLHRHAENGSFHFLTTNVSASFPLTQYSGVRFASRFPMLWPVAGIHNHRHRSSGQPSREERDRLAEHEAFFIDAMVADFARWEPKVVIVDERPDKPYILDREIGIGFDYIDYLSADPRFAEIWENYALVERTRHIAIFARR